MSNPFTKVKKIFNKDYNADIYRKYNSDLQYLTEHNLLKHFMQRGRHEKRISNISDLVEQEPELFYGDYNFLYPELNILEYRDLYEDLKDLSDREIVLHYHKYGSIEQRRPNSKKEIAKINETQYDVDFYGSFHLDLCSMTKSQLNNHFLVYGLNEKRVGSFSVFLEKEKIDMTLLKRFNSNNEALQLMDTMNQGTLARWILENNENQKNNPKYQVEFTINEYNLNKTHPYYDIINVASHETFRKIHTSHEMFDFINTNNYHKKYNNSPFPYASWVYNEETFYNAYPAFDLAYYKNRYRKDIVETKLDTLVYYHTIGRLNRHAINNTYTIIFYTLLYLPNVGGIKCVYNMAKTINSYNLPNVNAKMFNIYNKTYINPTCNETIYYHELHDNCVTVYPELIKGNPLKSNYVVRWILLQLGYETPVSIKNMWNRSDLIYNWEIKPTVSSNILRKHIVNPIFTNRNRLKKRKQMCVLIKKGPLINKEWPLQRHPSQCICLDPITEVFSDFKDESVCDILNKCKLMYTYDIKTMWIVYALFCGCVVVIMPPNKLKISEKSFFEQSIFNYEGTIHRGGISWGDHPRDIQKAIDTLPEQITILKTIFENENKYVRNFIKDIISRIK